MAEGGDGARGGGGGATELTSEGQVKSGRLEATTRRGQGTQRCTAGMRTCQCHGTSPGQVVVVRSRGKTVGIQDGHEGPGTGMEVEIAVGVMEVVTVELGGDGTRRGHRRRQRGR